MAVVATESSVMWRPYHEAQAAAAAEPIVPVFYPLGETVRYAVGFDIGQSSDPSAICVVQYAEGVLDSRNSFERAHYPFDYDKAEKVERLDVRFLERLPLGLSYVRQIEHVAALMQRPPLCDHKDTRLIADQTGVGAPVLDLVQRVVPRLTRLTITGASVQDVTWAGTDHAHVSKTHLVSLVDAGLASGKLRIAATLPEASTLKNELLDFRRKQTDAGRSIYAAKLSRHDDLVMSLCLAVWWHNKPAVPRVSLGGY